MSLCLASALSANASETTFDLSSWSPRITGNVLQYTRTETVLSSVEGIPGLPEQSGYVQVETVEAPETIDGQIAAVVLTQIDGYDMLRRKTIWTTEGLEILKAEQLDAIEPETIPYLAGYAVVMPASLTVGTGVALDIRYTGATGNTTTREELTWTAIGVESVEVPAGMFDALRIEVTGTITSPYTNSTDISTETDYGEDGPPLSESDVPVTMPGQYTAILHYVKDVGLVCAQETTVAYSTNEDGYSVETTTTVTRELTASDGALPVTYENGEALTVDVTTGTAPLAVTFTLENVTEPSSVLWDFDSNNVADLAGTQVTCSHTFAEAGTYSVSVSAMVDGTAYTFGAKVTVDASPDAPVVESLDALFAEDNTAAPATVTLQATVTANVSVSAYRWDLDADGEIDQVTTIPTVSHVYTAAGEVSAAVTVVDENGLEDSGRVSLTVTEPIAAAIVIRSPEADASLPAGYFYVTWDTVLPAGVTDQSVTALLYDATGQEVLRATASEDGCAQARILLDASALSTGVYQLALALTTDGVVTSDTENINLEVVELSQEPAQTTTLSGTGVQQLLGLTQSGGMFALQVTSQKVPQSVVLPGVAEVTLPVGASSDEATLRVFELTTDPDTQAKVRARIRAGTMVTGISLDVEGVTASFAQPVRISLQYDDADEDGLLDDTGYAVTSLSVFRLTDDGMWVEQDATLDTANHCFSLVSMQTGDFVLQRARADAGLASIASVALSLNGESFSVGEEATLRLTARCDDEALLNVYVAFQTGGALLFLRAPGEFYPAGQILPLEAGIARDLSQNPYFNTALLDVDVPDNLAGLTGAWYAALVPAGETLSSVTEGDYVLSSGVTMTIGE